MAKIDNDNPFLFLNRIKDRVMTKMQDNQTQIGLLSDLEKTIQENITLRDTQQPITKDTPQFMINHLRENAQTNINTEKVVLPTEQSPSVKNVEPEKQSAAQPEKKEETQNLKLLDRKKIKDLVPKLTEKIFGQDEVVQEVVDVLKVAALNIKANKEKPAGNYIFAGPSGVGKTELAATLAKSLDVPLLKINMGEYGLEEAVTKLIGAAPGYAGYNEGGTLTNFVSKEQRCIVLFDELEKAHESIDKILLSILDHGNCTDNKGNNVSFTQTIVICTTNLGADLEYHEGFTQEEKNAYRMDAIKAGMRPEIINRFDSIFHFHPLSKDVYKKVATKFLNSIQESIKEEHNFNVKYTEKMMDFIVEKSYDPAMGGRPARKFIEKVVIKPLADFMLGDEFDDAIKAHADVTLDINKDGNIYFKGKNRKVLGILENTQELIQRTEDNKFSGKKKVKP